MVIFTSYNILGAKGYGYKKTNAKDELFYCSYFNDYRFEWYSITEIHICR